MRASRHRLIVIGVVAAILVAVTLIAGSRRMQSPGDYALPVPGPSWLTAVDDGVLVCHREGRLVKLTWELEDTGTGWARPFTHPAGFTGRAAVGEGRVFVSCADARLRGVDLTTGLQVWETVVGAGASEPTRAGDGVFFGADDGVLYAVSAADGEIRWRTKLGARIAAAPLVTPDRVVVGTIAGVVHCLRRGDGEKLWRVMVGGPVYASPRRVGDSYLVGADDGVLYRISDEGELAGQFETDGLIRAPVALSGDWAVVGDSAGVVSCIELPGMAARWSRRLSGTVIAAPVIDGDRVWCAAGRDLICLRLSTGRVLLHRRGAAQTISCILADGRVYWTSADGRVHKEKVRR
ncbi:MAG: PQQ-binding-like beta-propeller repeat protein [Armatimonadetes bacterium]|nr:PQQ-binding-like beta-propeller repeat protein [Armatimonadota bacterium]